MLGRRILWGPFGLATALLLSGCAGSSSPAADESGSGARPAVVECRGLWSALGRTIAGRGEAAAGAAGQPSALHERWVSVVATVDYYAASADTDDCPGPLAAQRAAITALEGFGTKLAPYDMVRQLAQVQAPAAQYAARTAPPTRAPGRPAPPRPAAVGRALAQLRAHAPTAVTEMEPGWGQARQVDLDDAAAVTTALRDLAFLSTDSAAFGRCARALRTIRAALATR